GGEAVTRKLGDGRGREPTEGQSDTGAGEERGGQERRCVLRRGADAGREEQRAEREDEAAGRRDDALAETIREPACDRREGRGHQWARRERDTSLDRRVVPDAGEEERVREQEGEERECEDERAEGRDREGAN